MASFDLETFLKVQGQGGTGAFQALGMSFGLPSCMLNLAQGAMALLPSSILSNISSQIEAGKSKANNHMKQVFQKLSMDTGIIEWDTEEGMIKFKSRTGWDGQDNDNNQEQSNLGGLLGAFQFAASYGAQIYQNVQGIIDQVEEITECLDKFNELQKYQSGNSANQKGTLPPEEAELLFEQEYAGQKAKLKSTMDYMKKCDDQIQAINSILQSREADPSLEPLLLDSSELDPFLDQTNFERVPLLDPEEGADEEDIFRLSYGPPISELGQYVLTNDGLYYDSRSGGLDPVYLAISGVVPVGEKWKYDYDPNLGGKGDAISIASLKAYTDNVFDPSRIDDSLGMKYFYDEDHFLSVVMQQRDKNVYDLSGDLTRYIQEYGEDSSIVKNQRQLIITDIANHNSKINRRKKQIEISVKIPQIYSDSDEPQFPPGETPVNDFAYLEEYNLSIDVEKQRELIFEQAEVAGVVLPLEPRFAVSRPTPDSMKIDHLNVPTIGKGSILYSPSSTNAGTVLSLTDQIESDGLFAIYNFLETKLVLPSSMDFKTTNCATTNMYNNGQLVGPSKRTVFASGLAIPYLEGIVKNKSSSPTTASALGSYFKLPDTPEFRDLTYSPSGFSMECWVHVPNIMDAAVGWMSATTSSLTKVLLGSENVGHASGCRRSPGEGETDLDYLYNDRGEQFVRGMLCGFTRDRRITEAGTPLGLSGFSNENSDNDPASSLSFFIAPTQSRDSSSASFINDDDCADYPTYYNMKVDLSATDFGNVSSQFVLVDVTVDPGKDEVKFYADGNLVATSAVTSVFGVDKKDAPQLPSFRKENSFEYSSTTVDGPQSLKTGPLLNPFYTPWIVGGGYTDGMYEHGNFLGGGFRGGLVSGLRGHVGSLKFYSRPLNNLEVLQNYKAQQGFFKNIRI